MQKGGTWWVHEGLKSHQFKSLPDTHHWRKKHPITPKEYSYFQIITACIWLLEEICTHQKKPFITFYGLSSLFHMAVWKSAVSIVHVEQKKGTVMWFIDGLLIVKKERINIKTKKAPKESSLIQECRVCQLHMYWHHAHILCWGQSMQLKEKKKIVDRPFKQ